MVYCRKCGTKNEEGVKYCIQCGAVLGVSRRTYEKQEKQEKQEKDEKHEKDEMESCFGSSRNLRYFWLLLGTVIIIWGVTDILNAYFHTNVEIWPILLIVVGLFIIYQVLQHLRR